MSSCHQGNYRHKIYIMISVTTLYLQPESNKELIRDVDGIRRYISGRLGWQRPTRVNAIDRDARKRAPGSPGDLSRAPKNTAAADPGRNLSLRHGALVALWKSAGIVTPGMRDT